MKDWKLNDRYINFYFSQADNEEEYVQLAKNLSKDMKVIKIFSCAQWEEVENMFDNDWVFWHTFFDTEVMYDEKYDDGISEVPNPLKFNGIINTKPKSIEYPVMVLFKLGLEDYTDSIITWQSIR